MHLRKRALLTALLLMIVMSLVLMPLTALAAEEGARLTILHVNDRHGRMNADPYISQMALDLRAKGENVLILDAGDALHGQTPANLSQGEAMVELMNAVGYSAMALGNHDFNFGVERLQELSQLMDFPLLAANVRTAAGESLFQPYASFDFDGLKVGVFGLATPETVSQSDPRIVAGLVFDEPAPAAAAMVEALKAEGCDIIIALVHLGVDTATAAANRSEAVAAVPGVDVVIDGHSHSALEYGQASGQALLAQTGAFSANIGVVEINVVKGVALEKTARLVAVPQEDEETELKADPLIVAKIAAEEEKMAPITSQVVGHTPVLLQGEREFVRTGETNLANVITDSMRYATGAEIAFLTGGNIRASIEAGDITMGQVLTTLPFANLLVTAELSGADLLAALEHGVSAYPQPVGQHIQVAGLSFEFDPAAAPGSRVSKVVMEDGLELDTNKTYTVATIEFIMEGGDGYDMMARGQNRINYQGDAEALAAYLAANPDIAAEPQLRVKPLTAVVAPETPTPAPLLVPAPTPAAAIYIVQPGDTLSQIAELYGTSWQELQRLNKISNPHLIFPGRQLVLPQAS